MCHLHVQGSVGRDCRTTGERLYSDADANGDLSEHPLRPGADAKQRDGWNQHWRSEGPWTTSYDRRTDRCRKVDPVPVVAELCSSIQPYSDICGLGFGTGFCLPPWHGVSSARQQALGSRRRLRQGQHSRLSSGIINPTANEQYYLHLIETLAATINEKCATIPRINASGVVINTCGFVKDAGYTALFHAAKNFKIDVVIVLENERLVNNLTKDLPNFVKIVHEPKSGGVEPRATTQRQKSRHDVVKSYFYGTRHTIYHPFTIEISYGVPEEEQQLIIAKVRTEKLPDSGLPVGVVLEDHRTKVVKLQITSDLKQLLHGTTRQRF